MRAALPALLCCVALAGRASADPVEGGEHRRLVTDRGPVHVWWPQGYDRRTAGVVLYVHGYWTSVDGAWTEHQLARQFRASHRNAVFIVPEAPSSKADEVRWPALGDLLETVARQTGEPLPSGAVVAVGHSGAFRTIVGWLDEPRLEHVILLDALYSGSDKFAAWIGARPDHRLVIAAADTLGQADELARGFAGGAQRARLPDSPRGFGAAERDARLLLLKSQYGHMEIVTEGRAIPLLLHLAPLVPIERATPP